MPLREAYLIGGTQQKQPEQLHCRRLQVKLEMRAQFYLQSMSMKIQQYPLQTTEIFVGACFAIASLVLKELKKFVCVYVNLCNASHQYFGTPFIIKDYWI